MIHCQVLKYVLFSFAVRCHRTATQSEGLKHKRSLPQLVFCYPPPTHSMTDCSIKLGTFTFLRLKLVLHAINPKQDLSKPVFRIHMFSGLPDPDPLVRGVDPDTSIVEQNSKKNLDSYCFVTFIGLISISQGHGSADPDPDPHQNVMDPEHFSKIFGPLFNPSYKLIGSNFSR
jgi:hypothetical protein